MKFLIKYFSYKINHLSQCHKMGLKLFHSLTQNFMGFLQKYFSQELGARGLKVCDCNFIRNSNEISENLWTPLCVKNGFSFITINGMAIKVLLSKQAVLYFIRHSSRSDSLFVLLKVTSNKSCGELHLLVRYKIWRLNCFFDYFFVHFLFKNESFISLMGKWCKSVKLCKCFKNCSWFSNKFGF